MILEMLSQPFMRNAFIAGGVIAAASGLVGYFILLRGQLFAGDALSHVAFTGTLAAVLVGLDPRLGLYGGTVLVALVIAGLGTNARTDDVAIGAVFAFVLGIGVLLLSLFTEMGSGANSATATSALFGSILGLDTRAVWVILAVGGAAAGVLLAIARPLLFATLDEGVAAARGVPTRLLGVVFLALVGFVAAEAAQAVGALLLLGLLAAPAAAAQLVVRDPYRALGASALLGLVSMWAGLTMSYALPSAPPSFTIIATAGGLYGLAFLVRRARTS